MPPNIIPVKMGINCKTLLAAYTVNRVYVSKCSIDDICKSVVEQIKHESEMLVLKYESQKISTMYSMNTICVFSHKTIIMMLHCLN